jgi:nucleotide-binding universal stress UspA family protein
MNDTTPAQTNRLLVGMDLTEAGDRALMEALSLAQQLPHCEVHAAHVIALPRPVHNAARLDLISDQLQGKLSEIRVRASEICAFPWVRPPRALPIVFHVRTGDPAQALHQLAVDIDATLLIVGTHARTGFDKLMLGSVADVLTRTARLSVLVAHPKNFVGLERSEVIEPASDAPTHKLTQHLHLEYRDNRTHISGLI